MRHRRPDSDITRCTCGAWAWLGEPCPDCGHDVTDTYQPMHTPREETA